MTKVVAFLPAKGKSDRIKNKNLAILDGEYLFRRQLINLLKCKNIDEIYLDTESEEIMNLSKGLDIKLLKRDEKFSNNSTDGHELFSNEVEKVEADIYIQILCTAPFLSAERIDDAIETLKKSDNNSLVAVCKTKQYLWEGGVPAYGFDRIPNSVDLPYSIVEAMSFYAVKKEGLTKPIKRFTKNPIFFELTPKESIDINIPADLELAEEICLGERTKGYARLQVLRNHLSSPVLSDVCKEMGFKSNLPPDIIPISQGKVLGYAKTLELVEVNQEKSDWRGIYDALSSYNFIRSGDVIVVKNQVKESAYFGELNANIAIRSGAVAAIIDGYTRDTEAIESYKFPVYAKGSYAKDIKFEGTTKAINESITIGDVQIKNNDYIFADKDGVVCIPAEKWQEVLVRSIKVLDNEWQIKKSILEMSEISILINKYGDF